jgi:hypothetical protein
MCLPCSRLKLKYLPVSAWFICIVRFRESLHFSFEVRFANTSKNRSVFSGVRFCEELGVKLSLLTRLAAVHNLFCFRQDHNMA